jgi:hypothetical protein
MHRELITSGGGSNSTETETPPVSESTPESNPNPQPPPVPPTDPTATYIKSLQDTLDRNAEIMRRMEERLSTPTTQTPAPAPAPAPRSAEEVNKEYYESPGTFVERRIDAALERTVKPLNDFVANFRSNEQVDRLISEVKQNPRLAAQWDAAVEETVRKQLSSVPAANLNLGLAQQATVNAIGLKALGAIGSAPIPNPVPTPNPEPTVTIPANIRPSNPPAPNSRPAKKVVELNENERVMARQNRQTPEEFVFWRDIPADKVMTAKWDKAKNEGTY